MIEKLYLDCRRVVASTAADICLDQGVEPVIRLTSTAVRVGQFYSIAPEILWDVITDTLKWPLWGPTVRSTRCSDRYIGMGTKGQVLTSVGIRLPFIVTHYEHLRFWSWKVGPFRATGHRLDSVQTGGCNLWFETPMIAAPYALICRKALVNIDALLAASSNTACNS